MFIKQHVVSGVSGCEEPLPDDLQRFTIVNAPLKRAASVEERSGERPLRYVLFCQVVVQVTSQSADSHRCHVTGTAVCETREEEKMFEETTTHYCYVVGHRLTWKDLLPPLHPPVRLQLFQQLVSDDLRDDALCGDKQNMNCSSIYQRRRERLS